MKVLIVEDELLLAMNTKMDVESMGHEVVGIAESSDAAFDIMDEHAPELVLMDIVIQGHMNGIELAIAISDRHPRCKVLYVTAHSDDETLARLRHTKHLGVLTKPFEPNQLQSLLDSAA